MGSKYIDIPAILGRGYTFNFIIGARGIGKTYGALKYIIDSGINAIYMRRTQTVIDLMCTDATNPFKRLNMDMGTDYYIKRLQKIGYILDDTGVRGYALALSTFGNVKGPDFSDIQFIFFDEFLRGANEPALKKEAFLFFDMYETVARNREANGEGAPQVLLASNSTEIDSPILAALGLIPEIEKMILTGQKRACNKERDYQIVMGRGYGISEEKRKTALYKLTAGTNYGNMALDNDFINDSFLYIERQDLTEYRPLFAWAGLYFYKHKSLPMIYVCWSRHDGIEYNDEALYLVLRSGYQLKWTYMSGNMRFSDFTAKNKFLKMVSMA